MEEWNGACMCLYLHLPKFFFVLLTPGQSLNDAAAKQGEPDPTHILKRLDIHQLLHPSLLGQQPRALQKPLSQEVIRDEPIEPLPAPGLVLDVLVRVQAVHLVEVPDAGACLVVKPPFLVGVRGQLALHAAHAGDHGVEVAQDILLRGAAGHGGRGGLFEEGLEGRGVLLDGEVGGAEVFAEELVG